MKSSKFLTTLGLTTVLTVSGVNILPFASTESLVNSSKVEAAVSIRNDYVWMDMPQTGNQNDKWSCGPTSAARVMNFYGHNVNRDSLVNAINKDFVIPPSFNVPAPTWKNPFGTRRVDIRTGTTPHALRDVMKRWEGDNVKLERKADFNKLLGLLRQGKPVVVLLRVGSEKIVGTTWPAMHWVVVNGFSASEQKIYFTETSDGKIYDYSYGEFQSNWDWRVGKGLASEALYKNGVEPKTMIWVDRVPPVVAQSQDTPSQPSILVASNTNYQQFRLQTGTALHETGDNFDFAVLSNGDLMGIKKSSTGSGKTEVHILSASSNYQQFRLQTATALHETGDNFDFAVLSNGDLMGIKKSSTGSGKTEVHILSASSNYQQFRLQTATALHETGDNFDFAVLSNGDLMGIKKSSTGSGKTEVHILSASSNYQQFRLQTATALHETASNFDFAVLSNGDLMGIKKSSTGSGKTEVHILSASSNYQQFRLQTATALHETASNFDFAVLSNGDLMGIKKSSTGSGKTEVHILRI
ncbi:hypothetical protein BDGGKGIB_02335 [Nodularia sphaerocarpa UHCC 0038]|nr:hypothetical protein BDGGKGIB_02335 [Nodularia sphaerocarpa UHCC 0038]